MNAQGQDLPNELTISGHLSDLKDRRTRLMEEREELEVRVSACQVRLDQIHQLVDSIDRATAPFEPQTGPGLDSAKAMPHPQAIGH